MKLVIPRDRWERGSRAGLLWNEKTDCGCALGHYGLALGYSKEELTGHGAPTEVFMFDDDISCRWPDWLVRQSYDEETDDDEPSYEDTRAVETIVNSNDNADLTDEIRELQIMEFFARRGITVEFV